MSSYIFTVAHKNQDRGLREASVSDVAIAVQSPNTFYDFH
jgi:hypothetical protein